ncbi:hypothetical protein SynMITS9220M01_048 [Synechococcus phage SynMITS9220M01]|nr:hypothetical protein SynMITS9220M01_048 [Synechococcus phage SynMITS9220M01]
MYGEEYEETPKQKEYFRLLAALQQIDNIVSLLEDNQWKDYIYNHLSPVRYELERQLANLTGTNLYTKIERTSDEDND